MSLFKIFALVLLLYGGVHSEKCSDCVNIQNCPKITEVLENTANMNIKTMQLIINATCGNETISKNQNLKVCCSLFTNTFHKEIEIKGISEIIRHANLKLLPEECGLFSPSTIDILVNLAEMYEFPWIAIIAHQTQDGVVNKCTGSIINKRYILTSAQCVDKSNIVGVRVGEFRIRTDVDCDIGNCESHVQDITVENSVIHEDYYKRPTVINDIALLRLAEDIDFNHKNVDRICLPTTSERLRVALDNKVGTVAGWGLFTIPNYYQYNLYRADVKILTAQNCSEYNNSRLLDSDATVDRLCAASYSGDPCMADPGSPLMFKEYHNNVYRYVQYGIFSMRRQRCAWDVPLMYTDVTKFMRWILDNISP